MMEEVLDYDEDVDYGDLPPSIEIDEAVLMYRHLLVHLGLHRLEQCIGEGAHGAVYQVGERSVVKLTTDIDEAVASAHLARRPCANVVSIRRVAGLPDTVMQEDHAQWFVIERELLETPSERDQKILETIWQLYDGDDADESLMVPTGHKMLDRWRDTLRDCLTPRDLKRAVWILTHVGSGARELGELGLEWSDLHDENVMRRPGSHYVIADPGPGVVTGWRRNRPIRITGIRARWRPPKGVAREAEALPDQQPS